jgi:signal transduction histidine kinase
LSTSTAPDSSPAIGEQLHLQTRRARTTAMLLLGVVFVLLTNAHPAHLVSYEMVPLWIFLGLFIVVLVGATLTIKRGVRHPLYLLFNWSETALLTLGIGVLITLEGTAHSLLWLLYFSTVLHGARAALYRRFNYVMFSVSPVAIASIFLVQRNLTAAVLSLGLGAAALYLHRLFLAAADRESALALERDRLREIVASMAVVEERERIARDLHDGFGASLNAALWQSRRGTSTPATLAVEHRLMACLDELGALVWAARREDRDLATFWSHLRARCDDLFSAEVAISYAFPEPEAETILDDRLAVAAMFITLEAVRNSVRHARAARVSISGSAEPHALSIEVSDDGVGFDPEVAARGHGLQHMEERARSVGGEMMIRSQAGETSIRARLPILG